MQSSQTSQIESHILKKFTILKKVGSGAYGHVWKVEDRINKKIYALKKIFDAFQHSTDAQRTYREIEILKQIEHPNIIKLFETIKAENNKDVYLVFQFMEADLHNVISQGILKQVHIRYIIYQLCKALKYMHSGNIIHRDLKPSNILINSNCLIKLCDFGLVRSINTDNSSGSVMTEGVATRWYRAPEVLLGSKSYSTPADIWSFACIIYEVLVQKPMFAGNSTIDQIDKMLSFTGYPSDEDIKSLQSDIAKSMLKQSKITYNNPQVNLNIKNLPPHFADLLQRMLVFNPQKRITIEQMLSHEAVRQFKKVQEELVCKKQIKPFIDDNKKLTVQDYRLLIYGSRSLLNPNKKVSSSLQVKNNYPIRKQNSSGKIQNVHAPQKNEIKQKEPFRYCRSTKDFTKSLHNYNRVTEPNEQSAYKMKNEQLIKQGVKSLHSAKTNVYERYGDLRVNQQIAQSGITSPKYMTAKTPLVKSSKYLSQKNFQK